MTRPRNSYRRYDRATGRDFMDMTAQLVVSRTGDMRLTRSPGKLAAHEVAIGLKLTIPLAVFDRPALSATITVDGGAPKVYLDVAAAQDALRQSLGVDVALTVVSP